MQQYQQFDSIEEKHLQFLSDHVIYLHDLLGSSIDVYSVFLRGKAQFIFGLAGLLWSILLWQGSYWCAGNGFPPVSSPLPPGSSRLRTFLHTRGLSSVSLWCCRSSLPLTSRFAPVYRRFSTASTILFMAVWCIYLTGFCPAPLRACRATLLQDSF